MSYISFLYFLRFYNGFLISLYIIIQKMVIFFKKKKKLKEFPIIIEELNYSI